MPSDLLSADHLILFLAFFVPGFIALQVYGLFVAIDDSDITKRLPTVVAFSAIHYALTGWVLLIEPPGLLRNISAYIIVFILPALWPPLLLLVRDFKRWGPVFLTRTYGITIKAMLRPEATEWDRVLSPEGRYIRIKLKSGAYVGGYYGVGSGVTTYPCDREIFIRQAYRFDENGVFGDQIENTGILVQGSEIEYLETIELESK